MYVTKIMLFLGIIGILIDVNILHVSPNYTMQVYAAIFKEMFPNDSFLKKYTPSIRYLLEHVTGG